MARFEIHGRKYQDESAIRERVSQLDAEHEGRPMPGAAKEEWNSLNEAIAEFDARRARVREIAQNPRNREAACDDSSPASRDVSDRRSQALSVNERVPFLSDASRAHMEQQIREDDDPRGSLAQATIALADRDYLRAFAKWMRDPISGGHAWTNKERDAVQKVRYVERAMALGAGGTGGFLVPYSLDPAVILAGVGDLALAADRPCRHHRAERETARDEPRCDVELGSGG